MKKILFTLIFATLFSIQEGQSQYLDTLGIANLQDSLSTFFPDICKKVVIGTSVKGRDIIAMKFSNNVQTDEAEPEILFTSCMHGDEEFPEQSMMRLARQFCLDYNIDPQITNIINSREIWILPVINPDGLVGHFFGSRPNANGVDLNRNFGYLWNQDDFDPFPYSEPETKFVRDFILSRNFNIMIDFHAGLQGIIYPWYYKTDNCPDYTEIFYLANQYDILSGYPPGEFAVTSGADLYVTTGSMVEFAYGTLGIYAFAVELLAFGSGGVSGDIFTINKPSLFMMMEKAGEGISGVVSNANTGQPIEARIQITGKVPSYSSKTNGDFHHFLREGVYEITVSANGYHEETTNITVSNDELTIQDFELTPTDVYTAHKMVTSRNFNNPNDPAETWNVLGLSDDAYYAMGNSGYVVLDFGASVEDIIGEDITVHGDASATGNGFEVAHASSIDGPWTTLGTGETETSFDLNGATDARYFRIMDNGIGPNEVLGAGFHLDALTAGNINTSVHDFSQMLDLQVFPNPVQETLQIKGSNLNEIQSINILDINGSHVLKNHTETSIDLDPLSNGIYFIQITSKSEVITHKIIKQ